MRQKEKNDVPFSKTSNACHNRCPLKLYCRGSKVLTESKLDLPMNNWKLLKMSEAALPYFYSFEGLTRFAAACPHQLNVTDFLHNINGKFYLHGLWLGLDSCGNAKLCFTQCNLTFWCFCCYQLSHYQC